MKKHKMSEQDNLSTDIRKSVLTNEKGEWKHIYPDINGQGIRYDVFENNNGRPICEVFHPDLSDEDSRFTVYARENPTSKFELAGEYHDLKSANEVAEQNISNYYTRFDNFQVG